MKLFNKNKSIFDKINEHLMKKGHELVMSIFLNNFNGNDIYIRFDFIRKLSIYKIVWIDLNFFNEKEMDLYISSQMVTKFLSLKIMEKISSINHQGGYEEIKNIIGDRVEILTYLPNNQKEFVFDRFLPMEWKFLIDPLAMIFSYLPRSMDVFLNEIFAKFDGTEERYNYTKPIKFDLFKDDIDSKFKKHVITRGKKLYEDGAVKFLEKFEDKYYVIVEENNNKNLVILREIDNEYVLMYCNCPCDFYCKHIYAALLALRHKDFNNFYKVKYTGREESILEMVTITNFHLCYGINEDKILLISSDGSFYPANLIQKGKVVFEVIEDDDDCTLSKKIKEFKDK